MQIARKGDRLGGQQILLVPGSRAALRKDNTTREIPDEEILHISDVRAIVDTLLTEEELAFLDKHGDIEVLIGDDRQYSCLIAKSLGSFTIVVTLQPSVVRGI